MGTNNPTKYLQQNRSLASNLEPNCCAFFFNLIIFPTHKLELNLFSYLSSNLLLASYLALVLAHAVCR